MPVSLDLILTHALSQSQQAQLQTPRWNVYAQGYNSKVFPQKQNKTIEIKSEKNIL